MAFVSRTEMNWICDTCKTVIPTHDEEIYPTNWIRVELKESYKTSCHAFECFDLCEVCADEIKKELQDV